MVEWYWIFPSTNLQQWQELTFLWETKESRKLKIPQPHAAVGSSPLSSPATLSHHLRQRLALQSLTDSQPLALQSQALVLTHHLPSEEVKAKISQVSKPATEAKEGDKKGSATCVIRKSGRLATIAGSPGTVWAPSPQPLVLPQRGMFLVCTDFLRTKTPLRLRPHAAFCSSLPSFPATLLRHLPQGLTLHARILWALEALVGLVLVPVQSLHLPSNKKGKQPKFSKISSQKTTSPGLL